MKFLVSCLIVICAFRLSEFLQTKANEADLRPFNVEEPAEAPMGPSDF